MNENVSLIVIGTELTRGIIQDKHGQLVSREVSRLGYHMNEIVALPDDGSISHVLHALCQTNDIVIITGGLGPTSDDMTRSAIALAASVPLVKDEKAFARLLERVGADKAYGANEKQAFIPEGFETMLNPNGTAEGFFGRAGEVLLIALPGPPREMEPMFHDYVLPYLASLQGHHEQKRDEYSTFLIAEAKLEELTSSIDDEIEWGTRFQDYRISLYASGQSEEHRDRAIAKLRAECGDELVVCGDKTALSMVRAYLLKEGLTLSAAESCTGGLAASLLTDEAGASDFFLGSAVTYSNAAKERILNVPAECIETYGAVSRETARAMAEGAMVRFGSHTAFSITGVAGPGESERKKVGTVCFGFASQRKEATSVLVNFSSWGRASVRKKSVTAAFLLFLAYMEGKDLEQVVKSWKYI